jgi:5-methylcytosine-specific restriction endonuclease McrA
MSYIRTARTIEKLRASAIAAHPRKGCTVTCAMCGSDFYACPSRAAKAKCCSQFCGVAYRRQHEYRIARKEQSLGSRSHFWRGGITLTNKIERESAEAHAWRAAVFHRDGFTCCLCGRHGVKLHADHIVPFSVSRELRWVVSNGRTLCVSCHRATPTYGGRMMGAVNA